MLLSRNYPPSEKLSPFIARHYIFQADLPPDFTVIDSLLAETAFIRILVTGDWTGEITPGVWKRPGNVLFFGPNQAPLAVRVKGPFFVIGIALRPSAWKAFCDKPASVFADRMMRVGEVWGEDAERGLARAGLLRDDDEIVRASEAVIAACLREPDYDNAAMQYLESVAWSDSTMRVDDMAEAIGMSARQLARLSVAHFGHTPKTVLRRSRFLDMAAVLRGLGDSDDDYLATLRYFDQSHRSREFRHFIGMTPAEFERTPTPLLDAGLMLRQERKQQR